ncbi:MAG: hypothetical protein M1165_02365 [Candidatus Pacearchaeota archaeon]|nr:hypothetical protein [Candidatus Pacearchaeota archaeon]
MDYNAIYEVGGGILTAAIATGIILQGYFSRKGERETKKAARYLIQYMEQTKNEINQKLLEGRVQQ